MNRNYLYLAVLAFILLPGFLHAQEVANPNEYQEEVPVLLKHEYTAGLTIHSDGWGALFRRARNKTFNKKRFWEIEFLYMKHPKEIRLVNPYVENAKSFIYGKLNAFMILRGGYGRQRVLYEKVDRGGVAIRFNYGGGLSLGITKPIYLSIIQGTYPDNYLEIKKSSPDYQVEDIYGRASFTYGLSEMKVYPGLYAKAGLSFEYSRSHEDIKALEVGVALDGYLKNIPIMAFNVNRPYFFVFYLHVMLGKRWT